MFNIEWIDLKHAKIELKRTRVQLKEKLYNLLANLKNSFKIKINNKLDEIYYKTYANREKIIKIIARLIGTESILLISIAIILVLLSKNSILCWLILLTSWLSFGVIYLFLKFYHKFFGSLKIYEYDYSLTKEYIINKLPHIAKVYGKTGSGKDSLTIGCAGILANNMRNKLIIDLDELKRILYIFDFNHIDKFVINNYNLFTSFSMKINQYNLISVLNKNYGFIKQRFRKDISYKKLLNYYLLQLEQPTQFITKYSFYDGINYHAFYDLLLEYILKYIRVYIEANFIMSNQPVVESKEYNLMAKKFSMNFLQIKELSYQKGGNKYSSKMLFPWKNQMIILETEAGSWYFNRDKENSKVIYETGVRDFKAYNRHFIEDLYWFMVDQDALRVDKLLRELDHSYIQVLEKNVIDGGIKRVTFYNFLLNRINNKINKKERKVLKRENKISNYNRRLNIYEKLNKIKKVNKYKKRLNKTKKINLSNKLDKLYLKAKKYKEIVANAKNEGYITILINVSDQPSPVNLVQSTIYDIMKRTRPMYHESYQITLTFKIKDIHGRYDTHYMKAVAEEIALKSKLDFIDVPRWNQSLKINKNDALYMGYPASFNMFNITKKEYEKSRFDIEEKE